jgi:transcriptional regulator with XRE-family HTH domain
VNAQRDLPRDIGGFIRDLRRNAQISLRQLAEQAGVSNPYLSQIERGLRKPSAEVLAQLAHALRVSTPMMYLRAGLLDSRDGQGVLAAIAADPDLTIAQKQALTQIYDTFRRENARGTAEQPEQATAPVAPPAHEGSQPPAGEQGHPKPHATRATAAGTRKTSTAATNTAAGDTVAGDTAAPARKQRKAADRPSRTTQPEPSTRATSAKVTGAKEDEEKA